MKNTVAEHKEWLRAERSGHAFVAWDDAGGAQQLVPLTDAIDRASIGRGEGCVIRITDDQQVSRSHAVLERVGVDWVIIDEGMSRNGSWVNGDRIKRRRRLHNGDHIRVGQTLLVFVDARATDASGGESTVAGSTVSRVDLLTPAQRSVLEALCAPMRSDRYAAPATNAEIAEALHLSLDAVKGHMRMLFRLFEVGDLPQNKKRAQLAEIGVRSGLGGG